MQQAFGSVLMVYVSFPRLGDQLGACKQLDVVVECVNSIPVRILLAKENALAR